MITDPNFAVLLLALGVLAIYWELHAPGLALPGVGGVVAVFLAMAALHALPLSAVGLTLVVIAFVLLALEVKLGSFGVLGAFGAAALCFGLMRLVNEDSTPHVRPSVAGGVAVVFSAAVVFLARLALRAAEQKSITGLAAMMNEIAVAKTSLAPEGTVQVHGEYWSAESTFAVQAGALVRITAINGLKLSVEPIT